MSIKDVTARLRADIGDFKAKMSEAQGSLSGLKSSLSKAGDVAMGAGKAIAAMGAAAGAALAALTVRQMGVIDETAKLSRQLGFLTADFQALSLVAKEAGVEQNALGASLGIMSRNLFEASKGSGAASDALKGLGLNAKELLNLKPSEQFDEIAKKISSIENPTLKVAASMAIFGRSGKQLIGIFDEYAKKADEARQFNDKFNVSLSQVDAAKVEEANDAFGRVKMAMQGLGNTIAVEVAPLITALSNALLDAGIDGNTFSVAIQKAMEFVARSIDAVRMLLPAMEMGWLKVKITALESIRAIIEHIVSANVAVSDFAKRLGVNIGVSNGVLETWRNFDRSILNASNRMAELQIEQAKFISTSDKINEIKLDATRRAFERVKNEVNFAGISVDEFQKKTDKVDKKAKETEKTFKDLGMTFSSAFENAIIGGQKFSSVLQGLAQDMARIIMRRTITEPLSNSLSDALGSFSSGGASGSSGSGILNSIGNFFGGFFANGGRPPVGIPSIVGEKGAEVFVPDRAGTIVPNNKIGSIGGTTQNIVVNNNFEAGVTRQQIADLIPSIIRASENGVLNALQRGGSMSRAAGVQ